MPPYGLRLHGAIFNETHVEVLNGGYRKLHSKSFNNIKYKGQN